MRRVVLPTLALALAVAAGAGLATWLTGINPAPRGPDSPPPTDTPEASELTRLQAAYGPDKHSQGIEEWIVRDVFHDKRDGVFVDVGSADFKDGSNTWFLESERGWSGLAIDAQERYRAGYVKGRPRTRFFALFVSDQSNEKARLFLSRTSSFVASSDKAFTAQFGPLGDELEVPTMTLNDLLAAERVTGIDFLSMDIELAEPKALAGFDIERFRPQLVGIEAHPAVRQPILDYFTAHDYVVIGRYLRIDEANLWFQRLSNVNWLNREPSTGSISSGPASPQTPR
jgi:hypothetical protein